MYRELRAEELVTALRDSEEEEFLAGAREGLLFDGPDCQRYELTASSDQPERNHVVYIWTEPDCLEATVADYDKSFGLACSAPIRDFHGIGRVTTLVRAEPPITIGLLTPAPGESVAPRFSDDIFAQVGYSHFRLGTAAKEPVLAEHRQVFPDTGDVSYVLFHEAYLELVATETQL